MAVRARFGRLPRSAPSLTSTIVSLAQEYQRTRDRNLEDAWKNGGEFEGKPATDKMLLDHWKQRRSEVSQDDPMWDYYNNTISQLEFNIEESKMGQKYAEEKVSDGEMAAFYRKWAAKLPQDSEAYRQLMTQAAKFKSAAAARGRGRASNASGVAYAKKQQETFDHYEAPFDWLTSVIANAAIKRDILDPKDIYNDKGEPLPDHGWSKLVEASAEHDALQLVDLLSDIMGQADEGDPNDLVGNEHARMTVVMKEVWPDFNGVFDEATLAKAMGMASTGAHIRQDRAHKFGDKTGETDAKKKGAAYDRNTMITKALLGGPDRAHDGFIEVNARRRGKLDLILNDPTKSVSEQRDAMDDYALWLVNEGVPTFTKLFPAGSFDEFSPNFNPYAAGLVGRAQGTFNTLMGEPSGQTLRDDPLGFGTQEAGTGSDAFKLGNQALGIRTSMKLVDEGTGKQIRVDADGRIDPNGTHWGVFKNDDPDITALGEGGLVPFAVAADNFLGGEVRWGATTPIRIAMYAGVDPNTGNPVGEIKANETTDPGVGQKIDVTGPGGQSYTMWGVWDKGELVWTPLDPFTENGKHSGGVDERGNYVIGYVNPDLAPAFDEGVVGQGKPTFDPGLVVNRAGLARRMWDPTQNTQPGGGGFINSATGKPWNPSQDRDLSFYSPQSAAANLSEASLKALTAIGPEAVAKGEREWYAGQDPAKWSPDMKRMLAQGADPAAVIEAGGRMLTNDVAQKNREGYSPEQQQSSRRAESYYLAGRAGASRVGTYGGALTPEGIGKEWQAQQQVLSDKKAKDDLIVAMETWGTGTQPVPGAPRGARGEIPRESLSQRWISKGWTIKDLLTQPGMSVAQANDLAAQITRGGPFDAAGPGVPLPGQGLVSSLPRTGIGVANTVGPRTGPPPVNPYAPQGVVPTRRVAPAAPKPVATPAPAPTTSYVSPKVNAKLPSQHDLRNQHGATEFDY